MNSLTHYQRGLLLNFVEHNVCCPVFAIAGAAGYITQEERREALYNVPIDNFTQARIMLAMIMLIDNGEEF